MRRADLAIAGIFLAVIMLPGLGLLFGWDRHTISESEMRELAKPPLWTAESTPTGWLGEFERYFADHFAFRKLCIDWHAALLWYGLGTSASHTVIAGRDDWMFTTESLSFEVWRGLSPFREDQLEAWGRALENNREYLAQRGIEYLFVIGPNKETIYPEHQPAKAHRVQPIGVLARIHALQRSVLVEMLGQRQLDDVAGALGVGVQLVDGLVELGLADVRG